MPKPTPHYAPKDIQCWGHRGASAYLPENTLASFRAAIKEGAEGIESDMHVSSDGFLLMAHDPSLDRCYNGKGTIRSQPWKNGIEHVRTTKEPVQPIPLFQELIALIMEPENRHVTLNVDCKMQNDPETMFPEMARIISTYEDWESELAPRLILGLWHPVFIRPALKHLPRLRRYHIGVSTKLARQYFWEACEGFSMRFAVLVGEEGQKFIRDCREAGKEVCVWTVNDPSEMKTSISWGVHAVLTDKVAAFVKLRAEAIADPASLAISGLAGWVFPWSDWKYYTPTHLWLERTHLDVMRTVCFKPGPLQSADISDFADLLNGDSKLVDSTPLASSPEVATEAVANGHEHDAKSEADAIIPVAQAVAVAA